MGLFDSIFGKDEPPTTPSAKGTKKPATLTPVGANATSGPPIKLATPATTRKPQDNPDYVYASEDIAFDRLKRLEGWHSKGILIGDETTATAGWGSKLKRDEQGKFTIPIKKGEVLTREEADKLVRDRIRYEFIPALKKLDPNWDKKTANQQAAMISYMHHTGPGIGTERGKDGELKKQMYVDAINSPNWKTEIPKAMLALKMTNKSLQDAIDNRQKKLVSLWNTPDNKEEQANLIDQDFTDYPNIR